MSLVAARLLGAFVVSTVELLFPGNFLKSPPKLPILGVVISPVAAPGSFSIPSLPSMGYSELFFGADSGEFPITGPSANFPLILAGLLDSDRLKASVLTAIEKIKLESEQTLFSKRNSAGSSSSVDDLASATKMLGLAAEAIQFQADGILQAQANVTSNMAFSLLGQ